MKDLDRHFVGQVVAVTGGARGIGRRIAHAFGQEGAAVVLCDIDQRTGEAAKAELRDRGATAEFLPTDLSQRGVPQTMVRQIVQQFGRLDILINNARWTVKAGLFEEDEESWERGMAVSLRAPFFAAQEAIRMMEKTGGGSIVNISSVLAFVTTPSASVSYHVAKAGLVQLTRYLAASAGRVGVRVNAILPGFIVQQEHWDRYTQDENHRYRDLAEFCHPLRHVGGSDDVAHACLFLCSPEASFITGQCLIVDGGLTTQEPFDLLFAFDQQRGEAPSS
ncbi:MAG: SDR family oxidoreductase [Candidatus Omnitrophica bacterium]|nr:SDR family oxidoreductase [Candidatus Omnitrophota bacterium]